VRRLFNVWEALVAFGFLAFGILVLWVGMAYPRGTVGNMGPGFVPVALGYILVVLGSANLVRVAFQRIPPPAFAVRPIIAISLGLVAFALALPRFGLVPATFALVILSSLAQTKAQKPMGPLAIVVTATALSLFGVLTFVKLLRLSIPVMHW